MAIQQQFNSEEGRPEILRNISISGLNLKSEETQKKSDEFKIFEREMAFVDLETTGLDERVHEIIEIGVVVADQNTLEIKEEWQARIMPEFPERSNKLNREINGFDEQEWQGEPHLRDIINTFAVKLNRRELWSWNIQFEWRFLKTAFQNYNMDIHTVLGDYHGFDVIPLAKEELRRQNIADIRFSLSNVSDALGLPIEPYPHRAMNGARKAFEVYSTVRKLS